MRIEIIKCLEDNFSYLFIDEENNSACVIDPSEANPIIDRVEKLKLNLKFIIYQDILLDMFVIIFLIKIFYLQETHYFHWDVVEFLKELMKKCFHLYN